MDNEKFYAIAHIAAKSAVKRINKLFHQNDRGLYYEIWIDFDERNWEKYYPFAEKYPNLCIGFISNFFVKREKFYRGPKYIELLNKLVENVESH